MKYEIKAAALAGALTLSGMGGLPQPVRAEAPEPIVRPNTLASGLGAETPTLVFDQEAYTPNDRDAMFISDVSMLFLEAGSNPDFTKQMMDRYYKEFGTYFDILHAPEKSGFKYSPYGKGNPVLVDFLATEQISEDQQFRETANFLQITVGDDGTLFTPRTMIESFPLDNLPEMIDQNFTGVKGVEDITWETDTADPLKQTILVQATSPVSIIVVTGDTQGNLFYGTRFRAPLADEQ